MSMRNDYNATEAFNEMIAPLLKELDRLCYKSRIPMFVSCAVAQKDDVVQYESVMVSAEKVKRKLEDNRIAHHVRVANGYKTISPRDDETFDYE